MRHSKHILFYDACCVLCNHVIQGLLKLDKNGVIEVVPQSSNEAKTYLANRVLNQEVLLWTSGRLYAGVEAIINTLELLGRRWQLLAFFLKLVPRRLLRRLYQTVANNRYQWFGHPSCKIS